MQTDDINIEGMQILEDECHYMKASMLTCQCLSNTLAVEGRMQDNMYLPVEAVIAEK